MDNFKRVLSEQELSYIFESMGYAGGHGTFLDIANEVQQAMLAKLVGQEPSAFYIHDNKASDAYYTDHAPEAQEWAAKGVGVTALYDHPMPSRQGILDDSNHVVGNNKMVTPLAQRKIQTLLDKGEYRVIENATVLVNENGHAAIVNRGGAFYWVDNRELAREFDGAGVEVDSDHIADMCKMVPEGWQLVRVDPSEVQCLLIAKECGFEDRHSSRVWAELLAAAPKYGEGR